MRAAPTVVFLAVVLLAGCGSNPKLMENRVACTLDRSEAHILSKWGPVSVGTQVSQADTAVLCGSK